MQDEIRLAAALALGYATVGAMGTLLKACPRLPVIMIKGCSSYRGAIAPPPRLHWKTHLVLLS
eukprot:663152-Karenia_brevis.AAC.1